MAAMLMASCESNKSKSESFEAKESEVEQIPIFDESILENGDIIMKCGKGPLSKSIVKILDEAVPLSHCGIILRENNDLFVIHSVAKESSGTDGVQKLKLKYFLPDIQTGSLYILRHKSDKALRSQLIDYAKNYLEQKIPFDHSYDLLSPDKMYCSEFLYVVLKDVYNHDFFIRKQINDHEALTFNSLLDTSTFRFIVAGL